MVTQREEIVNVDRLNNFFDRKSGQFNRVNITSPLLDDFKKNTPVTDFNSLKSELLKISKMFPHRRVALTYKINDNSSLSIEVHPVTTTA